ncbi:MAG: cobalamin biosynthesis protein CobD [Osedax symbiont Rs2]|nr:MAG: cobalamin biosynthesis protein CobD [Osedax symbiont Rs2]
MWFLFAVVLLAIVLDYYFSEMRRHHPLVYFGAMAVEIERSFNKSKSLFAAVALPADVAKKIAGTLAWMLAVLPLTYVSFLLAQYIQVSGFYADLSSLLFAAIVLYIAIGWGSLSSHATAISKPLKAGDLKAARSALSMIVSRDCEALDESQIANAAAESVLENGADAIFAAIFWFLVLGVPGVVLYRLANTLDAMWGYKSERYLHFGWAAARLDDLLNYFPARLTALSYALLGNTKSALQCWKLQGLNWKSPNAGPVMAAGAGAINVRLGGGSYYAGQWQERGLLGPLSGQLPSAMAIDAACSLVDRVLGLWLLVLLLIALCW